MTIGDDRLPPWRERSLQKRANITDRTASPWKDAVRPGVEGGNQEGFLRLEPDQLPENACNTKGNSYC